MKCAVVVGVDRVEGLPLLTGAVSDAKKFDKWAKTQGFETILITDEKRAVTSETIYAAVKTFLRGEEDASQLIVYFAGHGFLKAPDAEIWLLSDALDNPNAAVNLASSIYSSRYAGIPHVVFISDCCRNLPERVSFMQISGNNIFPNEFNEDYTSEVDIFYATRPGRYAMEVPAGGENRGLFTECLLEGLGGKEPNIIKKMKLLDGSCKWVVTAFNLRQYLVEMVPKAIRYRGMPQKPEIRVESHDPKYLSDCDDRYLYQDSYQRGSSPLKGVNDRSLHVGLPESYDLSEALPDNEVIEKVRLARLFNTFSDANQNRIDQFIMGLDSADLKVLSNETEMIIHESLREDTDIQTGLAIYGTMVESIIVSFSDRTIAYKSGKYIDMRSGSGSALVICRDGRSIPVAILDGFVAKLIFYNEVLMTVNYSPGRGTPRFHQYNEFRREIEERRALMVTLSGNGFRSDDLLGNARYLRRLKALDPSLGLMAAYAYDLAGKKKDVVSVYNYIRQDGMPILFDIALLARQIETRVYPFCPMMTRNWSYLGKERAPTEISSHMVPGLWTTFTPEGTRMLLSNWPK